MAQVCTWAVAVWIHVPNRYGPLVFSSAKQQHLPPGVAVRLNEVTLARLSCLTVWGEDWGGEGGSRKAKAKPTAKPTAEVRRGRWRGGSANDGAG